MKKLQIEIPLILPNVPDEKDKCVHKLIERLQNKPGIDKVHISSEKENGIPQLCFHYNQDRKSKS